MTNLETHDMVGYWIDVIGLNGWTITTEHIPIMSVVYEKSIPFRDRYFVGVEIDRELMSARIYHDRPLNGEYVVHELLHVKYPNWSEDQVNVETERLLKQNKDDYSFTRVSVEERQRERSDKYDYLIGDDDDIKPNQNKDE
tara:strand:- start:193 stop:615 length:423 start_codon:yes stop_codon:yes gene_type:complete